MDTLDKVSLHQLNTFADFHTGSVENEVDALFRGRQIYNKSSAEGCLHLARQWVAECSSYHPKCLSRVPSTLPKRVINVGEAGKSDPRLERTAEQTGTYAWLSCSWGTSQLLKTTLENITDFMHAIPLKDLPPTFRDAIYLARELDIKYLYIDALCIIQGDTNDFLEELPKYGHYIAGAVCIFAAISSDAQNDLFRPRPGMDPLLSLKVNCHIESDKVTSHFVHFRKPMKAPHQSPLEFVMSRCWIIQEIFFAQRMIFFHQDQLIWNCNSCLRSEGSTVSMKPIMRLDIDYVATRALATSASSKHNFLGPWYSLIELCSQTQLSVESDRLPALAGLTYSVSAKINSDYVVGIWLSDLVRGLLWRCQGRLSVAKRPREYLAPTWSWVSLLAPISYSFAASVQPIRPHSPQLGSAPKVLDILADRNPFGPRIHDRYLYLSAMSQSLSDIGLHDCECYFDLLEYEDKWLEGSDEYTCILLGQHFTDLSDEGSRWIGLLLSDSETKSEAYSRAGVFLGPRFESSLSGWARRNFKIY